MLQPSFLHDQGVVSVSRDQVVSFNRKEVIDDRIDNSDDVNNPLFAHVIGESIQSGTNVKYLHLRFVDGEEAYVCDGAVLK